MKLCGDFNAQIVEDVTIEENGELSVVISDTINKVDCKMDKVNECFVSKNIFFKYSLITVKSLQLDFKTKQFKPKNIKMHKTEMGRPMYFNFCYLSVLKRL